MFSEGSKLSCSFTVSALHVLMSYLVKYGLIAGGERAARVRKIETECGSAGSEQYVLSDRPGAKLRNCGTNIKSCRLSLKLEKMRE